MGKKSSYLFSQFTCILHLLRVYYELTKWPAPSGLTAQLVEHCTDIAEVMGSNQMPRTSIVSGLLSFVSVVSSIVFSSQSLNLLREVRGASFESRLFRPEFFSGLNHIFNSLPSVPNLLTLDLVHNRKFHSCFQSWQPSFTSETFASLKTNLFHILVIRAWSTIHKIYL